MKLNVQGASVTSSTTSTITPKTRVLPTQGLGSRGVAGNTYVLPVLILYH